MKRPGSLLAFFPILFLLTPAGCSRQAELPEKTPSAPVKVVAAQRVSLGGWTELLGATQPLPGHAARISTAVEGHVLALLTDGEGKTVTEGQLVEKGQVIVRLDDRVAKAQRDKVAATLDEVAFQKKEAMSALKLAQLDVERLERLAPAGATSATIPLVSRIERDKARLALEDAETKQELPTAKERGIRAELQALDTQLDFYRLRAPIAGRLGTVQAVPGQTLAVGATVADVIDLMEIDVLCLAPPAASARLKPGQAAWIKSESDAEERHAGPGGKVVYVAVQAQSETGNFPVKVRFSNPDLRLRANAVVRVDVLSDPEVERLSLPEAALLEDQDPPGVIVVEDVIQEENAEGHAEKHGKAHKLQVRTGVRDRARQCVEIVGLEDPEKKAKVPLDNQLFVIKGGHGLHDGDAVQLEAEEKK